MTSAVGRRVRNIRRGAGTPALTDLTPLDQMTDVKIWLRPDVAQVTLESGLVSAIVNRGTLADVSQGTSSLQATYDESNAAFNDKPIMHFDHDLYVLPDLSSLTAFELFIVWRRDVDPPVGAETGAWSFGTSGSTQHVPFTDGSAYLDDGSTTRINAIAMGDTSPVQAYHVVSTAAEWTVRQDDSVLHTTATNTVGCHATPRLGAAFTNNWLSGDVADLIVCGTEQSAAARAWFNATYIARYGL